MITWCVSASNDDASPELSRVRVGSCTTRSCASTKTNISGSQCSCAILTCLAGTMLINWRDGYHSFRSRISLYCGVRIFSPSPARLWIEFQSSFRSAREGFPASIGTTQFLQSCRRIREGGLQKPCRRGPSLVCNRRIRDFWSCFAAACLTSDYRPGSRRTAKVPAHLSKWPVSDDHVSYDVPWREAKRKPARRSGEVSRLGSRHSRPTAAVISGRSACDFHRSAHPRPPRGLAMDRHFG